MLHGTFSPPGPFLFFLNALQKDVYSACPFFVKLEGWFAAGTGAGAVDDDDV